MLPFEKKKLFEDELLAMKQNNFIDEATYEKVSNGSNSYYKNMAEKIQIQQEAFRKVTLEKEQATISKKKQDSTERKTSALLNLGVLFLFLSGLIFATTNWSTMKLFGKVMAVVFMGGILSTGSYIADTRMSLKKTAYALWILTTLYIPIVGITFMYSLMWEKGTGIGEPISLLGLMGISLISSLINLLSIKKYKSKYYLWATYITTELSFLFLAGGIKNTLCRYIFAVLVSINIAVLYAYVKLNTKQYKLYTSQYLKAISYIVLVIALLEDNRSLNITHSFSIILLFLALLITSIVLNDKYIGIASMISLY